MYKLGFVVRLDQYFIFYVDKWQSQYHQQQGLVHGEWFKDWMRCVGRNGQTLNIGSGASSLKQTEYLVGTVSAVNPLIKTLS